MQNWRIIAQESRQNRRDCAGISWPFVQEKTGGLELQAKTFFRYPTLGPFIRAHQVHPAARL